MTGLTLILVPTIIWGGLFLLGGLTHGAAGVGAHHDLDATQTALFRAGHAHAGVLIILSLVIQVLLDSANLPPALKWTTRLAAPIGALTVSIAFFGLAFVPDFKWLTYFGAACVVVATLTTAVGLLRRPATAL
jgi:hypothetical protein